MALTLVVQGAIHEMTVREAACSVATSSKSFGELQDDVKVGIFRTAMRPTIIESNVEQADRVQQAFFRLPTVSSTWRERSQFSVRPVHFETDTHVS